MNSDVPIPLQGNKHVNSLIGSKKIVYGIKYQTDICF
jgi:hypothetical protein